MVDVYCNIIISLIIIFSLTDSLALKKAFTALMTRSPDAISQQLNKLLERLKEKQSSGHDISDQCGELVLRLNSQFPGDVGCFCIYFLNHIVLQPGEAMFLGPNLPHAYLAGGNKSLFLVNNTLNIYLLSSLLFAEHRPSIKHLHRTWF